MIRRSKAKNKKKLDEEIKRNLKKIGFKIK